MKLFKYSSDVMYSKIALTILHHLEIRRYLATRRPCLLTVNASGSVRQCSHCRTDALADGSQL